jgi:hypothetical protein
VENVFRDVTDSQEINGWWNARELIDRAKVTFQKRCCGEVLASIIAIAFLRATCEDNLAAWRMIEPKAVRWLSGNVVDLAPDIEAKP